MKAFYGDDIITPVEQQLQPKNGTEAKEQNVIKNKYVALLFGGLISFLVIFLGYNEMHSGGTVGGIVILCFGVLCLVIVILGFIQTLVKQLKDEKIIHYSVMMTKFTCMVEIIFIMKMKAKVFMVKIFILMKVKAKFHITKTFILILIMKMKI